VRNIAQVTTAVARGDLSQKITVDARGEILELKDTVNTMVDQLSSFADEVTRVAREVGTEGKLGGQAQVTGVAGTWRDLSGDANLARMAGLLQGQRDPGAVCQLLMNEVAPRVNAHIGAFFLVEDRERDAGPVDGPSEGQAGPRWGRRAGYALDTAAAPESFGA